jgi:glycosyltransferase involved in cell wall biosynthesis
MLLQTMMPMKICIISEYFPPRILGGGEHSAYLFARGLTKQGYEVHVLTSHPRHSIHPLVSDSREIPIHEKKAGIYVHRVLGVKTLRWRMFDLSGVCANEMFFIYSLFPILSFIIKERPDIIHALNIQSIPSSVVAARMCNVPIVVTYNSSGRVCVKGDLLRPDMSICDNPMSISTCFSCFSYYAKATGNSGILNRSKFLLPFLFLREFLTCSMFRGCLRKVNKIIAISASVKKSLVENGLPPKKIEVIPIIADLELFHGTARDMVIVRKEYGFSALDRIVLFVGSNFDVRKGSRFLIKTMPLVLETMPHVKFSIVGNVPSEESKIIDNEGLSGNVSFLGRISNKRLADVYAMADLVVVPSIAPEAFGRVVLEAMSMKKPVIASKVGGIVDIVRDGFNGFLVQPNDTEGLAKAILRVFQEKELVEKLVEEGKETVENQFSEKAVLLRIAGVYGAISRSDIKGN